ncbi:L-threonylcarbamoyladenylate synthase [Egicoccus halophilus]|uniref:Threonylcarbamoyl-AMP synthase n=1 Tax=Egicoccus halophilus TaxID=1670830 RepID=A0A8J3A8X6_9ACTN|nr:L-threonylcarbamoyladenylate synthase [Egicoccus halophilus]GGI04577.1 threonylcarbamoyl-AMP synthase [Egicoccus halophilus]
MTVPVDPAALARAAAALRAGGLVAFPTETVYGLGADALRAPAVRRIFAAKGRPADNPLIVHLADDEQVPTVAVWTPLARGLAREYWPGPLTLVLDAHPRVPAVTTGGLASVAVRIPDHPVAQALLHASGLPVAAPSANRSGRPSPTLADHVTADLGTAVDVVLDGGPTTVGVESTVVDARGERPVVLREGSVTRESLGLLGAATPDARRASPGTRYRHYAPRCRVELAAPARAAAAARHLAASGARVGLVARAPAPDDVLEIGRFTDAADLARRLYGLLRDAEDAGVDVLVVETVPEAGVGRAVQDRLRRAAGLA